MSSSVLPTLILAAASLTPHAYEAVEPHMGTLFRIKLYAADQAQADKAFRAAFARIAQIDSELSDYQPASELNRLSSRAVQQPLPVSDDLWKVVEASERLSRETGGVFDITIGPLTHLWRQARKANRVPEEAAIKAARSKCGYTKLRLDPLRRTIQFTEPGMQLDVGAIGKGYAADEALAAVRTLGVSSALIAASGDLAFSDSPPGEAGWKISVDSLDDAHQPFTRILLLQNCAVSTSGSSEQHLDTGGVRYSHIVDPDTGWGLTKNLTATVIAPHGMESDSLATAVSLLGVSRGLALVARHDGSTALIVVKTGAVMQIFEAPGVVRLETH